MISKGKDDNKSSIVAVVGAQWGDEGKGKLVDSLAAQADICCRFNGGGNAGHTVLLNPTTVLKLHLVPCGIIYPNVINLLGHGMVIHLQSLIEELECLEKYLPNARTRILISSRAHLLFDLHIKSDIASEKDKECSGSDLQTTRRGIGPCYSTKMARIGLRVGDLKNWDTFKSKYLYLSNTLQAQYKFVHDSEEELAKLKHCYQILSPFVVDGISWLYQQILEGKRVLIEGANAALLDIDFGTYPYVTSSSTTIGGISTGLGIPSSLLTDVYGVVKAYTTRVGKGPFLTELHGDEGELLRKVGYEFGATTGRPRRCGWLDLVQITYSIAINALTKLNLTKLDVLNGFKSIKICTQYRHKETGEILPPLALPVTCEDYQSYEPIYEVLQGWNEDISKCSSYSELPVNVQTYLDKIEFFCGIPIVSIGTGRGRTAFVYNH